ncbi:MAG: hypothetical protein AAGE59_34470 [Cyanobacteria bacterium P01_F01_bin.86]
MPAQWKRGLCSTNAPMVENKATVLLGGQFGFWRHGQTHRLKDYEPFELKWCKSTARDGWPSGSP